MPPARLECTAPGLGKCLKGKRTCTYIKDYLIFQGKSDLLMNYCFPVYYSDIFYYSSKTAAKNQPFSGDRVAPEKRVPCLPSPDSHRAIAGWQNGTRIRACSTQ